MSIVVGTEACNAKCPFCVAGMTPSHLESNKKDPEINDRNLDKALRFAQIGGASTILLTGKGEPTLYPKQIKHYLTAIDGYDFPFIELQTNGIRIAEELRWSGDLQDWYDLCLTTIMLSVVGVDPALNAQIYRDPYPDLAEQVKDLHKMKFMVRLCVVGIKGGVDSVYKLEELLEWCRVNKVEQVTWRPATDTDSGTRDFAINQWIANNYIGDQAEAEIREFVEEWGIPLRPLAHGSMIYEIDRQNICIANCLTTDPNSEDLRQIIFWPSGRITHDWQHEGAILL